MSALQILGLLSVKNVINNEINVSVYLQDYQSKVLFRVIPNAISSVLNLLTSKYPVIQQQALTTLSLLAKDSK
jgi:hypothetical protein